MNASKVAGMDGFEITHVKPLPSTVVRFPAYIFHKSLVQGRVPLHWLNCKMTCIPKEQSKSSVKDLRPFDDFSSMLQNCYNKTVLAMQQNIQQNIFEHSPGLLDHGPARVRV